MCLTRRGAKRERHRHLKEQVSFDLERLTVYLFFGWICFFKSQA